MIFIVDGHLNFDTKLNESGFKTGIDNLGSIASSGMDGLKSLFSSGMESIGQAVSKAFDTVVSFGKDTVQTGMDFSSAISQIGATLGYSVDAIHDSTTQAFQNMQMLTDKAEEMGAKTAFTAAQAAEGLNILAMNGYDAVQSVGMIDNVLNMASAGALGMADSAKYIAVAMKGFTNEADNFADSAEASQYYADLISKGATMAATSVDELGRAFSGSSALSNSFGQSSKEMEVALLRLAEQGTVAEEATTALKNILMNLYAPSQQARDVFNQIGGFSAFDANGQEKDLNSAADELNQMLQSYANGNKEIYDSMLTDIFSFRGATAFTKMMAASEETIQKFYTGIEEASGSAALQAETQLDNLTGDITIFQSALDGLRITIFKSLDAPFRDVVQKATGYLDKLNAEFKKNGWNGLGTFLGSFLADGLKEISNYTPQALKNARDFTKAFLKGLSVKKTTLAKTVSDMIQQFLKSGADALSDNFSILLPVSTEIFLSVIEELTKPENLSQAVDSGIQLLTAVGEGFGTSAGILIEKVPSIAENLKQGFEDNKDTLKEAGNSILSGIADGLGVPKSWDDVKSKLTEGFQNIDFAELTSNLSKLIIGVTDSAGNLVDGLDWSVLGGSLGEALNGVDWYGILDSALGFAVTALQQAPDLLKGLAEEIDAQTAAQIATIGVNLLIGKAMIGALVQYLASETALASLAPALGTLFSKCAPVIGAAIVGWDIGTLIRNSLDTETFDESFNEVIDGIRDKFLRAKATITSMFTGMNFDRAYESEVEKMYAKGNGFASEKYNNAFTQWKDSEQGSAGWTYHDKSLTDYIQSGATMVDNFASGISENSYKVTDAVNGITQEISDNLEHHSPARAGFLSTDDTWMPNMMQLFADGIQENAPLVAVQISSLTENIKSDIQNTVDNAVSWGSDMISNFVSGINQKWNHAVQTVSNFAGTIASYLHFSEPDKGALANFHTFSPDMMELFAQGIHQNVSRVTSQAKTLTQNLSGIFGNPLEIGSAVLKDEISLPALPEKQMFKIDTSEIREVSFEVQDMPEIQNPEIILDVPELPELSFSSPEIPALENQEISFNTPELPEIQNPEITLLSPEIPELDVKQISFSVPELPEIQNSEIFLNTDTLPDSISLNIDPSVLEAVRNASVSVTQDASKTSPVSQIINNQYYHSVNKNNYSQNAPVSPQRSEITVNSTIEMDYQTFGTAVKKVILDENSLSGGGFI